MAREIIINGTTYDIHRILGDGRCFSGAVFYDMNGPERDPNELNIWIQDNIIKPIIEKGPNNIDVIRWVFRYLCSLYVYNEYIILENIVQAGIDRAEYDNCCTIANFINMFLSTGGLLDSQTEVQAHTLCGDEELTLDNLKECLKRCKDALGYDKYSFLYGQYITYIESLNQQVMSNYIWTEPDVGPLEILEEKLGRKIVIYAKDNSNNGIIQPTPHYDGVAEISDKDTLKIYFNGRNHYDSIIEPSSLLGVGAEEEAEEEAEEGVSRKDELNPTYPAAVAAVAAVAEVTALAAVAAVADSTELTDLFNKIMALKARTGQNYREKIIIYLYRGQQLLDNSGGIAFNEKPINPEDELAFDILFLNVMWWIVDGLGHDLIYDYDNLSVDELWEQAKKILPPYKHAQAKEFLENSRSNDKTKANIRSLCDPIMLKSGLAYKANIFCPTGRYDINEQTSTRGSISRKASEFQKFEEFMNRLLDGNKSLQMRVDSSSSDFFKSYWKSYCTSMNDRSLNALAAVIMERSKTVEVPSTVNIRIEDTDTILTYLETYYERNPEVTKICDEFQTSWCGAAIDTTVQKDPLTMTTKLMIDNNGNGEFIQSSETGTDPKFPGAIDIIDENNADKIKVNGKGLTNLMFAPLVYVYPSDKYHSLAKTTSYRKPVVPEDLQKLVENLTSDEVIYQRVFFDHPYGNKEKYSINYVFNSKMAERSGVKKITKTLKKIFSNINSKKFKGGEYTDDCDGDTYNIVSDRSSYTITLLSEKGQKLKILFRMTFSTTLLNESKLLIFSTALLKTEGDYAQAIPSMQEKIYDVKVRDTLVKKGIRSENICDTGLSLDYLAAVKNILFSDRDLVCVTVKHGPVTMITPIYPGAADDTKEKAKLIITTIFNLVDGLGLVGGLNGYKSSTQSGYRESGFDKTTGRKQPTELIQKIIENTINYAYRNVERLINAYFDSDECGCIKVQDMSDNFNEFLNNLKDVIKKQYYRIIEDTVNEVIRSDDQLYDPLQVIEQLTNVDKISNSVPLLSTIYENVDIYYKNLAGYNIEFESAILYELAIICRFFCNTDFISLIDGNIEETCETIVKHLYEFNKLWSSEYTYNDLVMYMLLLIPSFKTRVDDILRTKPIEDEEYEDEDEEYEDEDENKEYEDEDEARDTIGKLKWKARGNPKITVSWQDSEMSDSESEYVLSQNQYYNDDEDDEDDDDMGKGIYLDEKEECSITSESESESAIELTCADLIKIITDGSLKIGEIDGSVTIYSNDIENSIEYVKNSLAERFVISALPTETIIENVRSRPYIGTQFLTQMISVLAKPTSSGSEHQTEKSPEELAVEERQKEEQKRLQQERQEKQKTSLRKKLTGLTFSNPKFDEGLLDKIKQFYKENRLSIPEKKGRGTTSEDLLYSNDISRLENDDKAKVEQLVTFIYETSTEEKKELKQQEQKSKSEVKSNYTEFIKCYDKNIVKIKNKIRPSEFFKGGPKERDKKMRDIYNIRGILFECRDKIQEKIKTMPPNIKKEIKEKIQNIEDVLEEYRQRKEELDVIQKAKQPTASRKRAAVADPTLSAASPTPEIPSEIPSDTGKRKRPPDGFDKRKRAAVSTPEISRPNGKREMQNVGFEQRKKSKRGGIKKKSNNFTKKIGGKISKNKTYKNKKIKKRKFTKKNIR